MNRVCISAIVPVYNTPSKFLCECIDSLLSQSYKNIQVLLIDDGSNKETKDICDLYAKKDVRITVIHQENSGPSVARNTGIQNVTGDFLSFIDSDDVLLPDAWEKAIQSMERLNADCGIYGWYDHGQNTATRKTVTDELKIMSASDAVCCIAADNDTCGGGYPWNKIWRTSSIRKNNNGKIPMFDTTLFAYEDKEWIIRTLDGLGNVVLLPQVFYDYRFVPSSLTNAAESWEKRQYNAYRAYDTILAFLEGRNKKAWRAAVNFYFYFCAVDTYNQYRHPKWVGIARCRRTKKSLYALCKRITCSDLDKPKAKLVWIWVQIWGLF